MQHESKTKLPNLVYVIIEGVGISAISGILGQVLTAVQQRKVCTFDDTEWTRSTKYD